MKRPELDIIIYCLEWGDMQTGTARMGVGFPYWIQNS
jgi:hypothetical protein